MIRKTCDVALADILEEAQREEKFRVSYWYDFGDKWDHSTESLGKACPETREEIPECLHFSRGTFLA
jgi:hypothetical protein